MNRGAPAACGAAWVLAVASGCDGRRATTPTPAELPFAQLGAATYMVMGLSSRVVDPHADELEARVRVGERIRLALVAEGGGCFRDDLWSSSRGTVAMAGPLPPAACGVLRARSDGELIVIGAGETRVTASFYGPDDVHYATGLGYCKEDAASPGYPVSCSSPRKIVRVRVSP